MEIIVKIIVEVRIVILVIVVIIICSGDVLFLPRHQADASGLRFDSSSNRIARSNDPVIGLIITLIPAIIRCVRCIIFEVYALIILKARVSLFHIILLEIDFHGCLVGLQLSIAQFVQISCLVIEIFEVDVGRRFLLLNTRLDLIFIAELEGFVGTYSGRCRGDQASIPC